jgi:hypothetical protein
MNRRKCPHRGPANMRKNYKEQEVVNGFITTVIKQGFRGFKGWALHPTKGWRRSKDFVPA